jgi:prolyl-tRNA synthetase
VQGSEAPVVALVLRGDHELNAIKAEKLAAVAPRCAFASEEQSPAGRRLQGPAPSARWACPSRCSPTAPRWPGRLRVRRQPRRPAPDRRELGPRPAGAAGADLRNVTEGDPSAGRQGHARIRRGIEVGHIFQLGDKYSKAMNACVLDEAGREVVMTMGCYGIGVSRIVAAAIEQNHDERGHLLARRLAPFEVALCP